MRILSFVLVLGLIPALGSAQRHKLTINAETPEGQMLQQIGQESDAAKKLALMAEFVNKHPSHEGAPWVLEQLTAAYLKNNQFAEALASAEKLLAGDPEDLGTSFNALKAAEGKKDADQVKKWSDSTSTLARKAIAAPKPGEESAAENWKANVEYARQVETYTEYALYVTALSSPDPAKRIMLYEALEARNPKSEHLPNLRSLYFISLRQSNANDKALAYAEKMLESDQSNEDMLLLVADNYFNRKHKPDQVIAYGLKLGEMMATKPKPEGVADEDWNKRKTLMGGLGYWLAGVTYANQSKFPETDRTLRLALPLVEGNNELKHQTLFYLGLANYRMGGPKKDKKLLSEALRFNQQCAAIKGPLTAQATKNAAVIKQELVTAR